MAELSHIGPDGASRMVDVGAKAATERVAVATGTVRMKAETFARIQEKGLAKGDVLEVARVAGIMGAKRTPDIVPLCHPIALSSVEIVYEVKPPDTVVVRATVKACDRTGVEMEALTAVTVCCLTIYDMAKAIDRGMTITDICLLEKTGGKSGDYRRPS